MNKQQNPSIFGKGLNWIANHTYRQIPTLINSYQQKMGQPKQLYFQDYIMSPQLARQAGMMYVRHMRKDYIKRKEEIQKVAEQFLSRNGESIEKPHELMCPICLELMNGPVTTGCSHSFCRMCIDEAILFSPTCPVCRNVIRGEQLIVSRSIQRIITALLYKLDIEDVEKFVIKQVQYQEWMEKRAVGRLEVDVGDWIDARDTEFIWCKATVLAVLPINCKGKDDREALLVHYEGWASVFDEVISLESQRLAKFKFYTSREEVPHYNLNQNNYSHLRSPVITGPLFVPEAIEVPESDSDSSQLQLNSSVQQSNFFNIPIQQNDNQTQSLQELPWNQPSVLQLSNQMNLQGQILQNQSVFAISLPPFQNYTNLFANQDYDTQNQDIINFNDSINLNHSLPEIRRLQELKNSEFPDRVNQLIDQIQDQKMQSDNKFNFNHLNLVDSLEIYASRDKSHKQGYNNILSLSQEKQKVQASQLQSYEFGSSFKKSESMCEKDCIKSVEVQLQKNHCNASLKQLSEDYIPETNQKQYTINVKLDHEDLNPEKKVEKNKPRRLSFNDQITILNDFKIEVSYPNENDKNSFKQGNLMEEKEIQLQNQQIDQSALQ